MEVGRKNSERNLKLECSLTLKVLYLLFFTKLFSLDNLLLNNLTKKIRCFLVNLNFQKVLFYNNRECLTFIIIIHFVLINKE